jgi:protein-S-isoprenylcysteine O-methyltransferase Ste14
MESPDKTHLQKQSVHRILAHSYSVYFIFFLIGLCLDLFFNLKVFNSSALTPIGLIFLILATILILSAQMTSRNLKKENISKETFCRGPYCYTRSPTHWGLFLLMIGFGLIANASFVILFTLVAFIITRFIFIDKEERILAEKYGTPYLEYKKIVEF